MTHLDLTYIAVAASAATAAVLITYYHLRQRSYERALRRVRAQRDAYRVEASELREERLTNRRLTFADHAAAATRVAVDRPVAYTVADRAASMPVFEGDNPAIAEYASTAAALRKRAGAR